MGSFSPAEIRLENMRHSVAEMFSVTVMLRLVSKCWNVPRTPAWARPKRLYPIQSVLKRVPRIANTKIDMKLSRKASLHRAMAESRMIGGSRKLKKMLLGLIKLLRLVLLTGWEVELIST